MIYLKVLGAALVALSSIMIPNILNRRLAQRLRCAEGWERLLVLIKNEIECYSLPIADILARTDPSILRLCGYTGGEAPKSLYELREKTAFTDIETEKTVCRFISEFGQCYKAEQVGRCEYFVTLMEARIRAIASELPEKKRLYFTLCLSAGLGILILFW